MNDSKSTYGRYRQWYLVAVSMVVIALAATDRQILALVVEPMRRDLGASDFKISLLGGLAFSLFYAVCALPIGRLIDGGRRPVILFWGILVWSAATVGTGFSQLFAVAFAMRMAVAVGEGSASPCCLGMITDVFLGRWLGQAINLAMLGAVVGQGVALIGGGFLLNDLTAAGGLILPGGITLHPWQAVFIAAGLPGLMVAPLVLLTIVEPMRKRVFHEPNGDRGGVSLAALGRFAHQNAGAVSAHAIGYATWSMGEKAMLFWGPTYLSRTFNLSSGSAGYYFGAVAVPIAIVGNLIVGALVDRATRAGRLDAALRIGRNAAAFGALPMAALPFMPTFAGSMTMLALSLGCTCGYSTVTIAQHQFAPNQVRAQYTALYLLISNIIGGILGASTVALVTEHLFKDRSMIGASLGLVGSGACVLSALILTAGIKPYRESMERIERQTRAAPAS